MHNYKPLEEELSSLFSAPSTVPGTLYEYLLDECVRIPKQPYKNVVSYKVRK